MITSLVCDIKFNLSTFEALGESEHNILMSKAKSKDIPICQDFKP